MSHLHALRPFNMTSPEAHPDSLVFDGLHYKLTNTTPQNLKLGGYDIEEVIELEVPDPNDEFPEENGPWFVIFNQLVYKRSNTDPAYIPDFVVRVSRKPISFFASPDLRVSVPHITALQPLQPPQAAAAQVAHACSPLVPSAPANAAPPTSPIYASVLPFGFDIVPDARLGVQYIEPVLNAPPAPAGVKKTRATWLPQHNAHLFYLLETAVRFLNRKLKQSDYKAVTEALHRQFRGTMNGPAAYTERGYNSVHSYVVKTRKVELAAIESRIFPEPAAPPRSNS